MKLTKTRLNHAATFCGWFAGVFTILDSYEIFPHKFCGVAIAIALVTHGWLSNQPPIPSFPAAARQRF